MTDLNTTFANGTYAVEYACGWLCRIEFDLSNIHKQYTHNQMRRTVDACHKQVHDWPAKPVRAEFTVTNTRQAASRR